MDNNKNMHNNNNNNNENNIDYEKLFGDLSNEKKKMAIEWHKNGFDIPTSFEQAAIYVREIATYKEDLKEASDDLKEYNYNLYKTMSSMSTLSYYNPEENIKLNTEFQIENDKTLADSFQQNESKIKSQIEKDMLLALSVAFEDEKKESNEEVFNMLKKSNTNDKKNKRVYHRSKKIRRKVNSELEKKIKEYEDKLFFLK